MLTPWKWIICIAAVLAFLFVGIDGYSCVKGHHAGKDIQQANHDHEAATTAAAQGVVHDQEAQAASDTVRSDSGEVAGLKTRLAQLRKNLDTAYAGQHQASTAPEPGPGGDHPAGNPKALVHDLKSVVDEQDEVIKAQDKKIQDQEKLIFSLTAARDSWRTAYYNSSAEAVQLRSALAAKDGLIRAAEIKGFIAGFALGNGTGAAGALLLKH